MTIAFLGDPASIHLRRWAGHFADRGHHVVLLLPDGQTVPPDLAGGISIERFAPHTTHGGFTFGMLATRRSMRSVIARVRPDILHVHYLTVHGIRAWLSGFHPYVVTVWGDDVLITVGQSRRARLFAWLSLRSADLVTGISRHVVDAAIRVGAKPDRVRVIHFGVDIDRFSPGPDPAALRERLGLAGRRVLFSPRTIARLYRHDTVIDSLSRLPDDVSLVMTRHLADPAELEAVERRIAEKGLASRVVIVPSVPHSDMADFYRLADVVVSVPESDAGPVTLVEALATGRSCVSSDLPPVRAWLADLDPVCLVPIGDATATARAIGDVLARGAAERARLAELGRTAVIERADYRRTMAEMEALYRALADR